MILSCTIPGRPRTWQRTRHHAGRRLTPKDQRAEKRRIATYARAALPAGWPLDATYALEVIGYWPDARVGDADRLVGLTMDALEGVAYRADRQVRVQTSSIVIDRDGEPRVELTCVPYDAERVRPCVTIGLVAAEAGT